MKFINQYQPFAQETRIRTFTVMYGASNQITITCPMLRQPVGQIVASMATIILLAEPIKPALLQSAINSPSAAYSFAFSMKTFNWWTALSNWPCPNFLTAFTNFVSNPLVSPWLRIPASLSAWRVDTPGANFSQQANDFDRRQQLTHQLAKGVAPNAAHGP